jgi:hypothetical protein
MEIINEIKKGNKNNNGIDEIIDDKHGLKILNQNSSSELLLVI